MNTGLSMLVPAAYEPSWTRLDDGNFNDYPPQPGSGPAGMPGLCGDAVFVQSIAIPAGISTTMAVVPSAGNRAFLLIQNNSTATGAGNTAPNLIVAYDGPITLAAGLNLTIPPGEGIVLDRNVPANAIYVQYAGGVGIFVAQGVIHHGLKVCPPSTVQ